MTSCHTSNWILIWNKMFILIVSLSVIFSNRMLCFKCRSTIHGESYIKWIAEIKQSWEWSEGKVIRLNEKAVSKILRKLKSESEVAQSCLTVCDPMDCSLPGSSVHGIFQNHEFIPIRKSPNVPKMGLKVINLVFRQGV